jgi:integrase
MKLTAKEIEKYRPPLGKDHIVFAEDFPGLGLRFRNGRATWIFQWSTGSGIARRSGRLKLGAYPALTPAKARETAQELHSRVTLGFDPSAEKRQRLAENEQTFGVLIADHLKAHQSKVKPKSYIDIVRYLDKYAVKLHRLPIANVDRRTIAKFLDDIGEEHGKIAMNRCRSALSNLFQWAMKKGRAEANPVIGTEVAEEKSRDRFLNDEELRKVWSVLGSDDYSDIVRLLILTGQRRGEIADLQWNEIHFERGVIVLPPERTKNGQRHEVPMSSAVRGILLGHPKTGERVFAPVVSWHRSREVLAKKAGFANWTLHDLRRSVSTGMGEIGILPHAIEAVLNHVGGFRSGVGGTYNRSPYFAEKKQALALWADHVLAVVEGRDSKVTPFRGNAS